MELLTMTGWTAGFFFCFSLIVLIQVRAAMISGGARLDLSSNKEYTEDEAWKAFKRVAEAHGWVTGDKK